MILFIFFLYFTTIDFYKNNTYEILTSNFDVEYLKYFPAYYSNDYYNFTKNFKCIDNSSYFSFN